MGLTRITRQRFSLSPFTSEQMAELGDEVLKSVKDRIHKSLTVDLQPAKPLKPTTHVDRNGELARLIPYPEQKRRKGKQPVRDLDMTGALMESIQVISANESRAVIASNNMVKDFVLHKNNRRSPMFGMSREDKEVMQKTIRQMLEANIKIVKS